ncbi:MAG: flagellar hook-associated protein 1 [Candidatus Poribacteria bacterium]|nr:MAG: flagellar hook-associated protein 1 [Candidatus Poribacteria bacterium]
MAILNGLGLLNSLQIGRRAVNANQSALEVTGKNIANVNTPGYTRQRATPGVSDPSVEAILNMPQVENLRDALTERLLLQEQGRFGSLTKQTELMSALESLINEPSDTGLDTALQRFFASAESLAATPESQGIRQELVERARVVAGTFRSLAEQLDATKQQNLLDAQTLVTEVNRRLQAVRELNVEILRTPEASARFEIQNRQEQLVRELAELIGVRMEERKDGTRTVLLNGITLASTTSAAELSVSSSQDGRLRLHAALGGQTVEVHPSSGALHGLARFQNELLPAIEADLHTLARQLIDQANGVLPGWTLLEPASDPAQRAQAALYLTVAVRGPADVEQPGVPNLGDLSIPEAQRLAQGLTQIQERRLPELENLTVPAFYRELVAALGAQSAELDQQQRTSELIKQQLETRREAISGVSLDEEAANMLVFQRGFQAAARYIQVVDQLLETIIERI